MCPRIREIPPGTEVYLQAMAPKKVMKSDAPLKRPKLTAKLDSKTFGRCHEAAKESLLSPGPFFF